ncbi:helix-turn-helix domain-containing protein [Vagococcus acidifermentans]|uniref:HTH cro/C1-type domain-containing protein n=1 Tax=Vagococcus acidifermentans TaxID=564710 RepID=A0A430AQB7_9ENTE|nr:Rgg/GadR/MutR family transcriptional regulator [Vagococcus acidifermentans]RSU10255.1 hypothetical protein CBF27_10950 [Vagococcus acidifermentans]
MHFGETFKKFRINKGLSLVDAADNIVSPQFLGRFEKGQSDMTISNLYLLLSHINVGIDEFFYEYQKNRALFSLEVFEEQLDLIYHTKDRHLWLKLYRKNLENVTEETNQYYHIDQCLKNWSNYVFKTEYIIDFQTIIDYLEAIETWGKYEYFLATFFIRNIPVKHLSLLFQKVFQKKIDQLPLQAQAYDFYFHVSTRLIAEKEYDLAEKVIEYFEKIQEPEKVLFNMWILASQKLLKAILLLDKEPEQGVLQCQQLLSLYEDLEFYIYAKRIKEIVFEMTGEKLV